MLPTSNELVLLNSETGEVQQFSANVTTTALALPEDLSYEHWLEFGHGLDRMTGGVMWWLGDWWAFGKQKYGERAEAVKELDWEFQTCRDAGWVANKIETSRRRDVLSWSHHKEVAALDAEEQEQFLTRWEKIAHDTGKPPTVKAARAEVSIYKRNKNRPQIEPPTTDLEVLGPFDVLYADPPWRYEFAETDNRAIENHYPTMDLQGICDLKPPVLENAVLFMWATATKIDEALAVIEAWGFDYKTSMVWVKDKIGMGYYVRNQHELLLIAKRGEIPVPAPDCRPSSVVEAPRVEHSRKPDEFYELIETMYPGRVYGEMFARRRRAGWGSWGNQV
jgi:N6-adenosine-specific RNA methylase IME4